ncbi:peptidyl-prolyl cis-trans isomerase [Neobacillus sp. PS3-40]|uniref:peptidyl-prolyl cis-trans isomerase n=1 Tax=Neobacillus sp. PS3-40 TaxID=3070679 RepID=UPI0027E15823|nr:peptidyl-prolyl cis-trans isomerase [Neobacillus sp. PS3-40]WML43572.1 peptidyl-prolyl cis-trans isomerase [Neobacillus sp. PS3-40]
MENIILITGNVNYSITLDPVVWIFDDRRIDLTTCFQAKEETFDELESYTKAISKNWDREIMEGAISPPTLKSEKKFEKEKVLTGTFGIPFKPFLTNAEPNSEAKILLIKSSDGDIEVPLEKAFDLIFGFSKNGKPLSSDGPIHIYFGDGSNQGNPIKNIKELIVK